MLFGYVVLEMDMRRRESGGAGALYPREMVRVRVRSIGRLEILKRIYESMVTD